MATIDHFSDPQKDVIRAMIENRPYLGRQQTMQALERAGLVERVAEATNPFWRVTSVAVAMVDEEKLRQNKPTDFTVGQRIERSHFGSHNGKWTHKWDKATIRKIGKSRLMLDFDDGRKGSCEPWYARPLPLTAPAVFKPREANNA